MKEEQQMSTATELHLDSITTGEAKLVLDKVIKQIAEQTGEILIASDDVKIIAYALENNLQLRDYLMGLTSDGLSVESVANILRVIVALLNSAELPAYPVETVLASYKYRLGDSDALTMLNAGLNRNYSLAQLLQRVFNAGWSPKEFETMANQLHSKVLAELTRTDHLVVNEACRV
jgi:hypothetical protein